MPEEIVGRILRLAGYKAWRCELDIHRALLFGPPAPRRPFRRRRESRSAALEGSSDLVSGQATLRDGATSNVISPADNSPLPRRALGWDGASSRAGWRLEDARRRGARGPVALAEMLHDALDDRRVGEEADNSHFASTSRTHQRVCLVHSPDQIRPTTPQRRPLRRCGDGVL